MAIGMGMTLTFEMGVGCGVSGLEELSRMMRWALLCPGACPRSVLSQLTSLSIAHPITWFNNQHLVHQLPISAYHQLCCRPLPNTPITELMVVVELLCPAKPPLLGPCLTAPPGPAISRPTQTPLITSAWIPSPSCVPTGGRETLFRLPDGPDLAVEGGC